MFDGVVRTLTRVLYVPSMNRHLISLATFDKEGFVCIGEGGVMKLEKDHKLFLKGFIDDDGLYKLFGPSIVRFLMLLPQPSFVMFMILLLIARM